MSSVQSPVYLEDKLEAVKGSGRLGFRAKALPTWCPGCGYFAVSEAVTAAFTKLQIVPKDTVVVSGIGCASRFPFFVNAYGFHTLHGRALPVATGVKVANEDLTVLVVGGDGELVAVTEPAVATGGSVVSAGVSGAGVSAAWAPPQAARTTRSPAPRIVRG